MFRNFLGYIICLVIAFALCENRKLYISNGRKNLTILGFGIALQLIVTALLLYRPTSVNAVKALADFILRMSDASIEGTKFVFSYLGGGEAPFAVKPGSSVFILGLQSLPMVIFISAFFAVLTHLRVFPILAKLLGFPFKYIFKISNATGTVAMAKVVLGQCEAPLTIRPYLDTLPKNEMFIIMALAFSTSSAAVMPVYAELLKNISNNAIEHFIIANIINIITTLILCSIVIPQDYTENKQSKYKTVKLYSSMTEALNVGLTAGTATWISIVGALIGMVALVSFINTLLAYFPAVNGSPMTIQRIIGAFLYPIVWLLDVPSGDISGISQVVGSKIVLNEIVSMAELAKQNLSEPSILKSIYMIGNFGNFSVIGITAAGLTVLAPKSPYIKPLMVTAFVVGLISTVMTTCVVSVML